MWLLDQLQPGNPAYNKTQAIRLTGSLNVTALEQSFNALIQRHEVLRTNFATRNDRPVQVIARTATFNLLKVNLGTLSEAERDVQIQHLATKEAQQPFNLSRDLLLRGTLLYLAANEYVLFLTVHHIVSDGWSDGLIIQELMVLYKGFCYGKPSPLPNLPIQYADFAVWQQKRLQGELLETQLAYWRSQLAGIPTLQLPSDHPRPPVQTFRGARLPLNLSKSLSEALKVLSQREGVTLFTVLLAAFNILLYRYTDQKDIPLGCPIANRNQAEVEGLIGFFANTLVLRTDLSGDPTFRELLTRVREVVSGAFTHQELPFEKLVEDLKPERNLSHNPLFQVVFFLNTAPMPDLKLPTLTLDVLPVERGTTVFDLTLEMVDTEQGLAGSLEYNTDLFDMVTMSRLLEHFQTLIQAIVANPKERISNLPLLTEVQKHQLLVEWNQTQADYPQNVCIHTLFEAQVERTPESIAVVSEENHFSYSQLNSRANQIARYLQSLGVNPGTRVGVYIERSVDMVVGILGILKAGGTYIPLDLSYPLERLIFMIDDAQISVLLTQEHLFDNFPSSFMRVVCIDADWEAFAQESQENCVCEVTTSHLAYIIYTSGSTGKPKGICVSHQSVNRLTFNTNYIKLESDDKVAQLSNVSFDAATFEIWGALLHGAQLTVINTDIVLSVWNFATVLHKEGISVLFLTTALFNQLVHEIPDNFSSIRYFLFGGEIVNPQRVKEVLKYIPPQKLLHVYGPTEVTTFSCCYSVNEVPEEATTIPIGRPISNTEVYLLDSNLQPVPIGVSGELYLGGPGLAYGYLNQPDLTAEKFIPNPFSTKSGTRLYKSGDQARYLSNGNLEYIGRIDEQVKIRGFRIELGEIESALNCHSTIQQSVVMVREDSPGDKRLVAYFVPHNPSAPSSSSELRHFLLKRLPQYMVPSNYILLTAFPLTVNGKVDRRKLPEPKSLDLKLEETFVAPRSALEETLVSIWTEILGLEQISINSNFFELGGHSLLATQLISRLRKAFHIELSLHVLFENPTVASLAMAIVQIQVEQISAENMNEIWAELEQISDDEVQPALIDECHFGSN